MKVQEYRLGNTKIEIFNDAYKDKSKEEIDQILARLAKIIKGEMQK